MLADAFEIAKKNFDGDNMAAANVRQVQVQLRKLGDAKIAEHSAGFFKTGPGEYGEGDKFIGVRVPVLRRVAKECKALPLVDIEVLVQSPIHEERLLAMFILVAKYSEGDTVVRKQVYDFYCRNIDHVNGWDLVDSTAHLIVGPHLRERSRRPLHQWAKSKRLWRRRIAIMSTYAFIKEGEFDETLEIAFTLLNDKEDLIHKAVGWMLREVGNRDRNTEESFLKPHYKAMPRTMLRYAIEKFPETLRKRYLAGSV